MSTISIQSRGGRGTSTVRIEDAGAWGGTTGKRVYVKEQRDYCCRPAFRGWRRTPLCQREARALRACRELGLTVPDVVHFERSGCDAVLVLAEVEDSIPLDAALTSHAEHRNDILSSLGAYLGRMHRASWYHGALYSYHILVSNQPAHTICLIDFEKARRSAWRRGEDLQRFWRHAVFLNARDKAALLTGYHDPG